MVAQKGEAPPATEIDADTDLQAMRAKLSAEPEMTPIWVSP
jgi:hypothetical protein